MFSSFLNILSNLLRRYSIKPNSAFSPNSYGNELFHVLLNSITFSQVLRCLTEVQRLCTLIYDTNFDINPTLYVLIQFNETRVVIKSNAIAIRYTGNSI